jgi:hypothetical protein
MAIKSVNFNIQATLQGGKKRTVDPVSSAKKANNKKRGNNSTKNQIPRLPSPPPVDTAQSRLVTRNNTAPTGQGGSLLTETSRVKIPEKNNRKLSLLESVKKVTGSGKRTQSVKRNRGKNIKKIPSEKKPTFQANEGTVQLEKIKR